MKTVIRGGASDQGQHLRHDARSALMFRRGHVHANCSAFSGLSRIQGG
jgi:hypothetical protein